MAKIKIAPSILSADFSRLADEAHLVEEAGAHLLHVDVMDGHFVPNITVGPLVVDCLKKATNLPLDVHLMIEDPARYIGQFADAGASMISVHLEAQVHLDEVVTRIKSLGVSAGVAINPATPISSIDEIVEEVDFVLLMSVNPGFAGQRFIPKSLRKVAALRQRLADRNLDIPIEVDGGITAGNAPELVEAGAGILVAGSAIYHAPDPIAALRDMVEASHSREFKGVLRK